MFLCQKCQNYDVLLFILARYTTFTYFISDSGKTAKIFGIVMGCIGALVILIGIVSACHKQKSNSNRNATRNHSRSDAQGTNRSSTLYTISMSREKRSQMEQLPPSYDTYMASLKQSNPGNPEY